METSHHSSHTQQIVETAMYTNIMNSTTMHYFYCATPHKLPAKDSLPCALYPIPPSSWWLPLSMIWNRECWSICRSIYSSQIRSGLPLKNVAGSANPSRLGVCDQVQLGVYCTSYLGARWKGYSEVDSEEYSLVLGKIHGAILSGVYRTVVQNVVENIIGGVVGCTYGDVLGSVLWVYIGVFSQPGWELIIKCNWEQICEQTWKYEVNQAGGQLYHVT